MNITEEYLRGEIASLTRQRDQHQANANAAQGAILAYEDLLKRLLKPEPQEATDAS